MAPSMHLHTEIYPNFLKYWYDIFDIDWKAKLVLKWFNIPYARPWDRHKIIWIDGYIKYWCHKSLINGQMFAWDSLLTIIIWHRYDIVDNDKQSCLVRKSLHTCPRSSLMSITTVLFIFSPSSEPLGQFKPNLTQCIHGWRKFKFVQTNRHIAQGEEIITELQKLIDEI